MKRDSVARYGNGYRALSGFSGKCPPPPSDLAFPARWYSACGEGSRWVGHEPPIPVGENDGTPNWLRRYRAGVRG